jgi:hypothetical protein
MNLKVFIFIIIIVITFIFVHNLNHFLQFCLFQNINLHLMWIMLVWLNLFMYNKYFFKFVFYSSNIHIMIPINFYFNIVFLHRFRKKINIIFLNMKSAFNIIDEIVELYLVLCGKMYIKIINTT